MADIPAVTSEMVTGIYNLPENQDRRFQSIDHAMVEASPKIYIFSVDPTPHVVSKGSLGEFVIPAKPEGARVSPPLVIPGFYPEHMHLGAEISPVHYNRGIDVAKDIVGVDSQDKTLQRHTSNLEWHGVFISETEKPSNKAIEKAESMRKQWLERLVADADQKYMSGHAINIDAKERSAAHELNLKKVWAEKPSAMDSCPACGSAVVPGVAVCAHCNAVLDENKARKFFPERFKTAEPEPPAKTK